MTKYLVEFHEVKKVTMRVEMDDLPDDEIREDFRDLSPEERAISVALEGGGIEVDSCYQTFIDPGFEASEDMMPTAKKVTRW